MEFCRFIFNIFCGVNNTQSRIVELRRNLTPSNDFKVKRYLNRVQYKYNQLKFKRRSFKLLRFLQVMGGFAITTMTTYNNPYFKDNSDKVNIMVWYVSISNNILNMLIEKLNAYDLTTMEVMVDLLITEGELYLNNEKDYKYYEGDLINKLIFFENCYIAIQKTNPYTYLSENNYPRHTSIKITNGRDVRLERVWAFPNPTPGPTPNPTPGPTPETDNVENLDGTEVQDEIHYDIRDEINYGIQGEIQGINQPGITNDV